MLILVFTVKHDYTYRSLRTWSFNRWKGLWYLGESRKSRPSCGSWRSWWSLGGRAENLKHAKTHYGICIITHSTWLHTTVELIVFALQHVPPRSTRLIPQPLANKCVRYSFRSRKRHLINIYTFLMPLSGTSAIHILGNEPLLRKQY